MESIFTSFLSLGWIQWASFITGLAYIYYAAKNDPACWPWGILSSALWAYVSWVQLTLLSDSILQVIYVLLGFWGWYAWVFKKQKTDFTISRTPVLNILIIIVVSVILSYALGKYMKSMNASYPMLDAFLTIFSVTATIGLILQKIENWLLWIVINLVSIPLFILRGGPLFAILFFIYFLLAIKGWFAWYKILKKQSPI